MPREVGAALLATAEGYTPRATNLLDEAREQLGSIQDIAAALADDLPAPKTGPSRSRRRRRRKKKLPAAGAAETPSVDPATGVGTAAGETPTGTRPAAETPAAETPAAKAATSSATTTPASTTPADPTTNGHVAHSRRRARRNPASESASLAVPSEPDPQPQSGLPLPPT